MVTWTAAGVFCWGAFFVGTFGSLCVFLETVFFLFFAKALIGPKSFDW